MDTYQRYCHFVSFFVPYIQHCRLECHKDNKNKCADLECQVYTLLRILKGIKESMMGLRPSQGNLRQVFRLFKSHPRLCRG